MSMQDTVAHTMIEITGKGKMHAFCMQREKILLDEPVVCRRDSLPLLRSCKVRFVGLDSNQHSMHDASVGNIAEWVRLSRASSNYSTMHADCLQLKSDGYGQPLPTTRHDSMSR